MICDVLIRDVRVMRDTVNECEAVCRGGVGCTYVL